MVAPVCEAMTEDGGLKELEEVGLRLLYPSSSKDSLCNTLEQASGLLSAIQQLPQMNVLTSMKPTMDALVKPDLLKHKDEDVQFLVTACISEIMRIVAPEAPYDDDTLKEIFELIVKSFKGLNDKGSRFFDKRMRILDSVASVRSCVVMLDLECDDLIREMFQTFFTVVSEEPKNIALAMRAIMCLVLEESEEIPLPLLEVLLRNLLRGRKGVSQTGYSLARAVFWRSDTHLRPHVETFLTSKTCKNKWSESYHDLIFELSQLNPAYVLPVVPKLIEELQTDKLEIRLKAVRLVGRILTSSKEKQIESYDSMFMELLNLISNNVVDVRLAVIDFAKHYLAKPPWPREQELLAALQDRLSDGDSGVRRQLVLTICNFAKLNLDIVPIDTLKKVSECLLDAEPMVRQETFQQLTEVHKEYCLKLSKGSDVELESFCWIPSKLIGYYSDEDPNDLRARALEVVLEDELFPVEFSAESKVNCWIFSFDTFDNKALKGFERILDEKQGLQQEMQKYLASLSLESQKSKLDVQDACKSIAKFFVQPAKAELELQSFSDSKLLKIITELLDVKTTSHKCLCLRGDLRKLYGEDGFKHDFFKELAIKCSFALFDKEHMQILLTKVKMYRSLGDEKMLKPCVGLMLVIARFFPGLLEGAEADVLELLKDDGILTKDEVVQILAKMGGSNSVNLLEKLCLEGSCKHVKHAAQALSALCHDSDSEVLTKLYGKLLDQLKSGTNFQTTLKSLGFIAQYSNSIMKEQRQEVVDLLLQDLLSKNSDSPDDDEQVGGITKLKISGLKTLVRTFVPVKELQHIEPPKVLFEALLGLLQYGEISETIVSSNLDKAHLRLAAADAVLQLSTLYDNQMSPQLFRATVSCAKDPSNFVKHGFLEKVYKGLMGQAVPFKYACAFVSSIDDGEAASLEKARQQLADYVKFARGVLSKKLSNTSSVSCRPDHVLFYLVHNLAQELNVTDGGPTFETVEPVFRKLCLFLWALLLNDGEVARIDASKEGDLDKIGFILGVFSAIKNAIDAEDASRTEISYAICDIGIAFIKDLLGDVFSSVKCVDSIPLPLQIYKSLEGDSMVDRSFLPSFLEESEALSNLKAGLPFGIEMVVKQTKRKADPGSLKESKLPLHKRSKVETKLPLSHEERKEKNKRTGNDKIQPIETVGDLHGPDFTTPVSPKRKRGAHYNSENGEVSSPEARHEQMDEVMPKTMRKPKALKVSVDEAEDVKHGETTASDIGSPDGSVIKRVRIFIKRPRQPAPTPILEPVHKEDSSNTKKLGRKEVDSALSDTKRRGRKEAVDAVHDDEAAETPAEPVLSPRGTPRRSSKLASGSALEASSPKPKFDRDEEASAQDLVGCRIRVWWPMDKKFYKGTIRLYQPSKKKHKVVYDDGDVEFLKLDEERWEMLKDTKETPSSPSMKLKAHNDDGSHSKERNESRSAKDGSDRRKSSNQFKIKKSPAKQGDTEMDDRSNRSDNTETMEQAQETVDGEETLASASKRRKSVDKNGLVGKKSTSKGDGKVDDNTVGESPSATVSKESRESGDVPLKAWKGGRRKAH